MEEGAEVSKPAPALSLTALGLATVQVERGDRDVPAAAPSQGPSRVIDSDGHVAAAARVTRSSRPPRSAYAGPASIGGGEASSRGAASVPGSDDSSGSDDSPAPPVHAWRIAMAMKNVTATGAASAIGARLGSPRGLGRRVGSLLTPTERASNEPGHLRARRRAARAQPRSARPNRASTRSSWCAAAAASCTGVSSGAKPCVVPG